MVKEFLEGETYTNADLGQDVMVLGIGSETKEEVVMAILWVDRESKATTGGGELTVKKSEFKRWSKAKL